MPESSRPLLTNLESTNHSDLSSRFADDSADDCVISVSRLREVELDTLTETSVWENSIMPRFLLAGRCWPLIGPMWDSYGFVAKPANAM